MRSKDIIDQEARSSEDLILYQNGKFLTSGKEIFSLKRD